jgi:hypothetical protein
VFDGNAFGIEGAVGYIVPVMLTAAPAVNTIMTPSIWVLGFLQLQGLNIFY